MTRRHAAALAAAIAFTVAACSGGGTPGQGTSESQEILVGEFSSLTGSTATFGQSTHNGITLAFDEINAAGGVLGKKLKLDLITPLDAETSDFSGPGIAKARVELAGYKGHRFEFDAGTHASFEFWNRGTATLREGFTFGWRPDPAKDPEGKGRCLLEVR